MMKRNDFLRRVLSFTGLSIYWSSHSMATENTSIEVKSDVITLPSIDRLKLVGVQDGYVCIVSDIGRGGQFSYVNSEQNLKADNGVVFSAVDGGFWQRIYQGEINVKWFGAKADGITDDTTSLKNAIACSRTKSSQSTIYFPGGVYLVKDTLVLDAGIKKVNAPLIRGDGARNSVLDFSKNIRKNCIEFGSAQSNTHYGGISGIGIEGNGKSNALTICSKAPYTASFNVFEDIRIHNVLDGINFEMLGENTTSCFCNKFRNFQIEKYFGIGLDSQGCYNAYDGFSISQPSGETSLTTPNRNYGSKTLAILARGASDTYNNIQVEDQVSILGYSCSISNLTIEHIVKGVSYPGETAIVIAGSYTVMNNILLIGIDNKVIKHIASVFSSDNSLQNWRYIIEGDESIYKIAYPILFNKDSSGIAININIKTLYALNTPQLGQNMKNWKLVNVISNGIDVSNG